MPNGHIVNNVFACPACGASIVTSSNAVVPSKANKPDGVVAATDHCYCGYRVARDV
jgi:hypothetical protein